MLKTNIITADGSLHLVLAFENENLLIVRSESNKMNMNKRTRSKLNKIVYLFVRNLIKKYMNKRTCPEFNEVIFLLMRWSVIGNV